MIYEYSSYFEEGNNEIILGFKCTYDANYRLCFVENHNQFDSHDMKIKIDNIVSKFNNVKRKEYENKYGNVIVLAISMYLFDNINEIEYVKFVYEKTVDILYKNEVLSMLINNEK